MKYGGKQIGRSAVVKYRWRRFGEGVISLMMPDKQIKKHDRAARAGGSGRTAWQTL